ncbi:MAG: hypothetical protein ACRDT8_19410, partial [Micromonosporaceae bacterium]
AQCAACGATIACLEIGWTHHDPTAGLYGWLCPLPHMTLAQPRQVDPLTDPAPPRRRPTPIPGTSRRTQPPHPGHPIT